MNSQYRYIAGGLTGIFMAVLLSGCDDDMSKIGNSIFQSEVSISVDSSVYSLDASVTDAPDYATRSDYTVLGSIDVEQYGHLQCSYVTRLLPAESISLPQDISPEDIDSVKLVLSIPRSGVTGDSVAPQQVKAYALASPLPDDITYKFNPAGYFDPAAPLGVRNFTLSGISVEAGSYTVDNQISVGIRLDRRIGVDALTAYADNPGLFVWPAEFAKKYPGLYVTTTFGQGCVAAISSSKIFAYYPVVTETTEKDENGETKIVEKRTAKSICLFSTAPEVLSSININYQPSASLISSIEAGHKIITTPGGYVVRFKFPAERILDEYWSSDYNLGVINSLSFSIPARKIENPYGIGVPSALLMVRTSDVESFFSEGRVPDNLTSFYSYYSATTGCYDFSSMRQYIVGLRAKGEGNITADDLDFTLVPVNIKIEEAVINNQTTTVVTSVTPYVSHPAMVELLTDEAKIEFTYSNQIIR